MDRTATTETVVDLPFGPCAVHVTGEGPPVLFVHGIIVNGSIWDALVPDLARDHTVIRPDLPLGAHALPARHRDRVTPEGVADALAALVEALGHEQVVVVGNDSGGAISQVFAARHPERVRALVLTTCDALDHFPPTLLKPMKPMLAIPGYVDLLGFLYRFRPVRRSFLGAGLVISDIDDAMIDPYFDRLSQDREARRDMATFIRGCRPALTHAAAEALESFPRPILLAWGRGDRLFPESDAEALHARWPTSDLAWIEDTKTFSMVDQPERLLALLRPFLERLPA